MINKLIFSSKLLLLGGALSLSLYPIVASEKTILNTKEKIKEIQSQLTGINENNVVEKAGEIWSSDIFKTYYDSFNQFVESFRDSECYKNAMSGKQWTQWRFSELQCHNKANESDQKLTTSDFRKEVIKQMTQTISDALKNNLGQTITWRAIGTAGPASDIDIVANCESCKTQNQNKKEIEVIAKSLFDLLNIHHFKHKSSGEIFDTEAYIDTTSDLKEGLSKETQDYNYRNLSITASQIQVARQLYNKNIMVGNKLIMTWKNYVELFKLGNRPGQTSFTNLNFTPILDEAKAFEDKNHPKEDPVKNIGYYIPIITKLSLEFYQGSDSLQKEKIGRVLETFFPEGYFSKESLAEVCYSADRYSQAFKTAIKEILNTNSSLTDQDIEDVKGTLIKPKPFIHLVSSGENIGYFFHKLDKASTTFDALFNSSKYLQRIARSLAMYWNVDLDLDFKKNSADPKIKYLYDLYQLASNFERLKRGAPPLTTLTDIKKTVKSTYTLMGQKRPSMNDSLPRTLYNLLYLDWKTTQSEKKERLKKLIDMDKLFIIWDETTKRYKASKNNPHKESKDFEEFITLLNLIINVEVNYSEKNQEVAIQELKNTGNVPLCKIDVSTPSFSSTYPWSKALKDFTPTDLEIFVKNLVRFYVYTLRDYTSIKLTKEKDNHILSAINIGSVLN